MTEDYLVGIDLGTTFVGRTNFPNFLPRLTKS
jgi:hypothetical protein